MEIKSSTRHAVFYAKATFEAEVAGESKRNEKIATKHRRPLLEPMRTHPMEPCVRI
ncbi:hypothetical protein PIB30_035411 [Stylosanthes scabra]|uniref:Uncharacterized protein n=1 Tax=Stylosanthes scabra TaxID=79078 RepID=A0ABU6QCN5_9FABA|nr:hypothetical protein [Stylosanthes scabra]